MNNDLYYWKYLKYKTKYLEEKNMIEGGGCDKELQNKINKINLLQYFDNIICLIQSNDKKGIIDLLKKIYENNVFTLLAYNKSCLAPVLQKYLEEKQDLLKENAIINVSIPTQNFKGGAGSIATFPNLTFTSLNIKIDDSGIFEEEIVNDESFTKGTSFLSNRVNKQKFLSNTTYEKLERNLRYLANLMHIRFTIDDKTYIESLRFGTPYAPTGVDNFYEAQIVIIKKYVAKKRCVLISFLDPCDNVFCNLTEKVQEDTITRKEISGYLLENFAYLNMSCNNGVNLKGTISGISDEDLKRKIDQHIDRLKEWTTDTKLDCKFLEILDKLKNNFEFFERFKKYVSDKVNIDNELQEQLKIRKFVLRKKPKDKAELISFEDNMTKFSPCEEDLTNEHIGLVMFCYISLIFYLLSKGLKENFILLYHCKSGQDRTGTFFAINQMVNQITTENYDEIISKILQGTSFIDIFFEYYSLTKKIEPIPEELKFCPKEPEKLKCLLQSKTVDSKINTKVELCYLRYLLFSYLMTITSTGIPGIKWGLTKTSVIMKLYNKRNYDAEGALDNRYGYLLLSSEIFVLLFEGGSQRRGA